MSRSNLPAASILLLASLVATTAWGSAPIGLSAAALFLEGGIEAITVSPSGDWAIAVASNRDTHGLLVQKLGSRRVTSLFSSSSPILGLGWVGESSCIVYLAVGGPRSAFVAEIREDEGEVTAQVDWVNAPGELVDSLPLVEGELVWAVEREDRSSIHRVAVEDLTHYERKRSNRGSVDLGETLAEVDGSVESWIVDRGGKPRAALRDDEDRYTILVRSHGERDFREIYSFDSAKEADAIYPQGLSPDGDKLIVAAYNGHDTMGLFELELDRGEIGETIFIREDVDVTGVRFDPTNGELIAAVYEVEGERRYHYFESYAGRHLESVRAAFPDAEVAVVSSSADRNILVLWVSGPRNPGTYYFHNVTTGEMNPIGQVAQELDRSRLVDVETVQVESLDGTRVEAFLALPRDLGEAGAPMIVMPHGGPIGVRDNKDYNPVVQYFASWGFAVLQVNYRGSSGYGLRFEEAGKRQWAQGIEDDIDAAVDYAIARPEIDGSRICIIGGSYGGFSALASVIRHGSRYRCAASLNGVTDIPLSFSEDSCADEPRCLRAFAAIVGDPKTEREKLMEISPAYHVDQIRTPVFVIYGTEDRRVDPEHSHRLLLMLETMGKDYESLEVKGAEHSFTKNEWHLVCLALRRFTTKYLFPSREFTGDPIRRSDESARFRELPTVDR